MTKKSQPEQEVQVSKVVFTFPETQVAVEADTIEEATKLAKKKVKENE